MPSSRRPALLLLLLTAALAGACGSSGGGGGTPVPPPTPATTFAGAYVAVGLQGDTNPPGTLPSGPLVASGTYSAASDGHGGLTLADGAYAYAGAPARVPFVDPRLPPGPEHTYSYVEDAERRLELRLLVSAGPVTLANGVVSPSGGVAVLTTVIDGMGPSLTLLVRRDAATETGDAEGTYHEVAWFSDELADLAGSAWGLRDVVGDGTWHSAWMAGNNDGVLWGVRRDADGTWTVEPDGGWAMVYASSGQQYEGGIGGGAVVGLLAGCMSHDVGVGVAALIRTSTGRTAAEFEGDWYAAGFQRRPSDLHYRCAAGTLHTTGAATFSFAPRVNDERTVSLSLGLNGTFSVAADGHLAMTIPAWGRYEGALAPDGQCAVLTGGHNAGDAPGIFLLVRR